MLADAVASTGVVAGVMAAVFTGWMQLDAIVALAVGVYILLSGWQLIKESVGGLMDEAVDEQTLAVIRGRIEKDAQGAIEAHDLKTRRAGPVTFIQFHLIVPAIMTVAEAHAICDRIENGLREAVPGARVAIHVEPESKAKHAGIILMGQGGFGRS